jgi:hypothetical protein
MRKCSNSKKKNIPLIISENGKILIVCPKDLKKKK